MAERPILFSAPMVRAIIEGRKTQTRRVVNPQPRVSDGFGAPPRYDRQRCAFFGGGYPEHGRLVSCPYGVAGDELWVRETLWRNGGYVATDPPPHDHAGRVPAIHMPRRSSRLLLRVLTVRVERLRDISEDDARAEGICWGRFGTGDPRTGMRDGYGLAGEPFAPSARGAFEDLWDTINGKRAPWSSDPWVWVVEFTPMVNAASRAADEARGR